MRDLFNQEEKKQEEVYKERYLITKENIIEDFRYEELVALESVLENKFVDLHTTRLDLVAKKEKNGRKRRRIRNHKIWFILFREKTERRSDRN